MIVGATKLALYLLILCGSLVVFCIVGTVLLVYSLFLFLRFVHLYFWGLLFIKAYRGVLDTSRGGQIEDRIWDLQKKR